MSSSLPGLSAPRQVTAVCRFTGPPGMEQEAAEAWAFELKYYFLRGVGEQPQVIYEHGIYTCTGLIQTTHFGDHDVTDFTPDQPWSLQFSMERPRRELLRGLYPSAEKRFDGR